MTNTLHLGSLGNDVATLQRRLNANGAHLTVDHIYGPATFAAVRAYQQRNHLVADGIAGPRTWVMLTHGISNPAHLAQADIDQAAAALNCEPAAIQAVIQVETGTSGWLPDGRVAILFERHIMYRQLKAANIDPDPFAQRHPDIVSQRPGGYRGGAGEYSRLALAKQINTPCALASASWGRFQIMGFHWQALGYETVDTFVQAMQSGEAEQLHAFVQFISADKGMHKALQEHDWHTFAHAYNGPASAKNHYAGRLERAYQRHRGPEPEVTTKPARKAKTNKPKPTGDAA